MTEILNVAVVQQACQHSWQENIETACRNLKRAAGMGAQLVLLPELHGLPYFCQTESVAHFDLAEPIPGRTTNRISRLAQDLGLVVVASVFERRAAGLYHNTSVVLDSDGGIAGLYRKMHIPDDPGFYEKFYFTPGDQGFQPIATSVGRLGVLVCWDQWFPEAARLMALAGAEMLLYPTAIGWDPRDDDGEKQRQLESWRLIQRAHAVANGLPVLSCNRIQLEPDPSHQTPGIHFWGNSFIAGPQGEIMAKADAEQETVLMVQIPRRRSEEIRRIWPFLRDRRIDAYHGLTRRYLD